MTLELIETGRMLPEELELFQQEQTDLDWLIDHEREIEERYPGKYFAVVNQELFVGDSYEEVEQKVLSKYPDRYPCIEYVPWTKETLIYDLLWPISLQ